MEYPIKLKRTPGDLPIVLDLLGTSYDKLAVQLEAYGVDVASRTLSSWAKDWNKGGVSPPLLIWMDIDAALAEMLKKTPRAKP